MRQLLVTMRLGIHDFLANLHLSLIMSLLITVAITMYASMETYRTGLTDEYARISDEWLVVQETQSFGEFYGSRLPSRVGLQLAEMGASLVVPSIHTLTGTSVQNAVLLRGIDLAHYQETELFTLTAGRSLQPGDAERLAMIGSRLLETKGITVGDAIQLRGREFTVVGIFHTGSYVDNEAWISLADAQRLLGWGEDVSVYLVPDEGILRENSSLPGGISVVRKGEGVRGVVFQYEPLIDLMSLVSLMLGAVVVLSMANIFLRLAWLRRRELAILRTVGFAPNALAGYLFAQVGGITLAGLLLSALATQGIIAGEKLTVAGFSIAPRLEPATVVSSLGWAVFIMLAGSLLPALWISRMNLSGLLHSE